MGERHLRTKINEAPYELHVLRPLSFQTDSRFPKQIRLRGITTPPHFTLYHPLDNDQQQNQLGKVH